MSKRRQRSEWLNANALTARIQKSFRTHSPGTSQDLVAVLRICRIFPHGLAALGRAPYRAVVEILFVVLVLQRGLAVVPFQGQDQY